MREARVAMTTAARRQRGSIMIFVAVLMSSMAMLSLALVMMVSSSTAEQRGSRGELNAIYVSEAGLAQAVCELNNGGDGNLGGGDQPVSYGGGSYWVQATDLGSNTFALRSTGRENSASAVVELIVRAENQSLFRWGAFGEEEMTMDSNAHVDSYDSSAGDYASQQINTNGNDRWANEDGDVGSNQNISLSSNSAVFGDATPGPDSTTTVTGNAHVSGTTLPMADTVDLPALVVPAIPNSGDYIVSSDTTLSSGSYNFSTFEVEGNEELTIIGPATIVVTNFFLNSNAEILVDGAEGPVEFFVLEDFVINSNTLLTSTTYTPADITVKLLSDNIIDPDTDIILAEVEFDSNAKMYGTIYAPDARVDIDSNFELFGAVVARQVHLDSNSYVHYDETLMNLVGGGAADYERLCWRLVGNQ